MPERTDVSRSRVAVFERAIDSLTARTIARDELADQDARRLRALIDKKKRVRKDVIRTTREDKDNDNNEAGEVDLLDVIRQSLRQASKKR